MLNFRGIMGYYDLKYPALDPTTPFFEFLSYCECCRSLDIKPSVQRFMRYNLYLKEIGVIK
jgi:hypothetical protein